MASMEHPFSLLHFFSTPSLMSRPQYSNYPSQATPHLSGGRPPPPARTVRSSHASRVPGPVAIRSENPAQIMIGSNMHCEIIAAENLKKVKHDIENNASLIASKLTCKLTKAQRDIQKDLYNDIDGIQKVIVGVMEAHRAVANTIRYTMRLQGSTRTHDVHKLLEPALRYIDVASGTLNRLTWHLTMRAETFQEQAETPAGALKTLFNSLVNFSVPETITGTGYTLAVSSVAYNSTHRTEIENHQMTAIMVQTALSAGAVVVTGALANLIKYLGREADIYKPEARKVTKDALISVHTIVRQLAQVLGNLDMYWKFSHHRLLDQGAQPVDQQQLGRIADLLDKHVDDCLEMACSIQRHIPVPGSTVLPTQVQLDEERKAHARGVPALPPYPERGITHGGNYFIGGLDL